MTGPGAGRPMGGPATRGRRAAVALAAILIAAPALLPAAPQSEGTPQAPGSPPEGAGTPPSPLTTNSALYKFEPNKLLGLDLAVGEVRAEAVRFEWPATLMRVKTAYKATVKVANGSSHQVRVGIAIALYDADGRLIGAGTTGTTLGTVDPGDAAQFTVEFNHVSQRLEEASKFHIALEAK